MADACGMCEDGGVWVDDVGFALTAGTKIRIGTALRGDDDEARVMLLL